MQYSLSYYPQTSLKTLLGCGLLSLLLTSGCSQSNDQSSAYADTTTVEQGAEEMAASDSADSFSVGTLDTDDSHELVNDSVDLDDNSEETQKESTPETRLAYALPEVAYEVDELPEIAAAANNAVWLAGEPVDAALAIKIQALLNYHHHSVGAVDGSLGRNVAKAMQVFQEKQGLEPTGVMDSQTWEALTADYDLHSQPVLVNYQLTKDDVTIPYQPKGQQYESVTEAVAEKFHMSQGLLTRLNPDTPLEAGNKILVYNPYRPNMTPVAHVVANKEKNLLLAYDKDEQLVASYPTTMGSNYRPSPEGEYKVTSRIINPTYNKDFSNKETMLPPGPNNPVGRVWIGINKPSFGIHGSPNPEKISQQKSSGCVRLTNWDVLGLYGTIEEGATVKFE
ncbi:L,D-transpeptidase family protein [Psychrobacter arenosus]|uniref:L,D-transpeptidase family protein n=1 Tax=Psychrobacter arenosus TaxID=256326 RepID=UPI00191A050B|nr:L,D-transpeptidase family protein [Psychrobacter arenosus]